MELPERDRYRLILETKINTEEKTQIKFFTKVDSKGITVDCRSHHQRATKIAMMRNEFRRSEL